MNLIKNFLIYCRIIKPVKINTPKIFPIPPLKEKPFEEIELRTIDLDNIDPDDLLNNNLDGSLNQIPNTWFVFEMGQSPIDRLWFCQLVEITSLMNDDVSYDDLTGVKKVTSIDKKTLTEAVTECLFKIEESDYDND